MKLVLSLLISISCCLFSNATLAQEAASQSRIHDSLVEINNAKNLDKVIKVTMAFGAGVLGTSAIVYTVGLGSGLLYRAGYIPLLASEDTYIAIGGYSVLGMATGAAIVGTATLALGIEALIKAITPTPAGGGTDTLEGYYLSSPEGLNAFFSMPLDQQEKFAMMSPKVQAAIVGLATRVRQ